MHITDNKTKKKLNAVYNKDSYSLQVPSVLSAMLCYY